MDKKAIQLDPKDCLDVIITDYRLHTTKARNPKPLGRQITKSFENNKPGRAYSKNLKLDKKSVVMSIDLGIKELQELARKKGKTYIRFLYPKNGVPVLLGTDTEERIEALKKKLLTKNSKKVV